MKKKLLSVFKINNALVFKAAVFAGFFAANFSLNAQTVTTIGQVGGNPSGIAVDDAGFVYIAERSPASKITKLNQTTGATSDFSVAGMVDPLDIEFGPDNKLYVADYSAGLILSIPSSGGPATNYVSGATQPVGITFDADTLYFIEYSSQLVYKVLPGGGAVGSANVIQITSTPLWMATGARGAGITLLSNGNLFVTAGLHYYQYEINKYNGTVIYDAEGLDNTVFGASQLSDGNLYMPGNSLNKIYKLTYGAAICAEFCGEGTSDSVDGTSTTSSFNSPYFIANDANDNLYVTDYISKKIRKISNAVAAFNEIEKGMISIYPNPASTSISIELDKASDLTIYSAEGKTVAQLDNKSNYLLDVSAFKDGVYYVQTTDGSTQKFIKQ